ncbi:MAG TPA: ABC transporter substrate-binding protein [Actinomycetota bacterium]|nr:ABC transporter substrate-binding protein [Actinomycetota bacterium]
MLSSLLAATVLLAAGCGGGDSEVESEATPARGGNLRIAVLEPDSIDPSRSSHRTGLLVLKQLCDTLVAFDPYTGDLVPGIAETWTPSPDMKKFTFKIRSGVKFHNGRDVTAEDFVYSLSRFASKTAGSSEYFLLELVLGYQDLRLEKAPALAGVRAIDAATLEIELTEPFAEFPAVLAHPAAGSAVPKEEVDKGPEIFAQNPVCTGPYKMVGAWEQGKDLTLQRVEGYQPPKGVDAGGYSKQIIFRPVPDAKAGYTLLGKGTVEISGVPLDDLVTARKTEGRVESGPNGILAYIGFPVTKAPYDNVQLRLALEAAIDRGAIINRLLAGTRRVPQGFLPPSTGTVGQASKCVRIGTGAQPDVAKKALKDAAIDPAATKPPLMFNDSDGNRRWLEEISSQWSKTLGIQAELRPAEWKAYLDSLTDPGADGPFRLAAIARYPSPEAILKPLFSTGSLDNFTRYSDPEFDKLMGEARSTAAVRAREGLYAKAAARLCETMPIAPMWLDLNHLAFSSKVLWTGDKRLDLFGDPVLRRMGTQS